MTKAVARPRRTKAATADQAIEALNMRLAGVPDHEICRRLGVSLSTLKRRIEWALAMRLEPAVDQYRTEQLARLEGYRRRLIAELDRPTGVLHTPDGDTIVLGAVDPVPIIRTLLAHEERVAKLLGLDAPTRVDVRHEVADAWATLEAELHAAATRDPDPAPAEETA